MNYRFYDSKNLLSAFKQKLSFNSYSFIQLLAKLTELNVV